MHHGTCVTHVPWCMPGSLTSGFLWKRRRGGNFPGIPGACATCNITYLVRAPWPKCNIISISNGMEVPLGSSVAKFYRYDMGQVSNQILTVSKSFVRRYIWMKLQGVFGGKTTGKANKHTELTFRWYVTGCKPTTTCISLAFQSSHTKANRLVIRGHCAIVISPRVTLINQITVHPLLMVVIFVPLQTSVQ